MSRREWAVSCSWPRWPDSSCKTRGTIVSGLKVIQSPVPTLHVPSFSFYCLFFFFLPDHNINIQLTLFKHTCFWRIPQKMFFVHFFFTERFCTGNTCLLGSVLSLMALFYTDVKSQATWGWKAPLDIIRSIFLLVVSYFFAYSIPSTIIRGLTEFASLCSVTWGLMQRTQNPTCTLRQNQLCYTRWYDLGCIQAERNYVFILATYGMKEKGNWNTR